MDILVALLARGACEVECPKGISLDYIAQLNRDLIKATLKAKPVGAGKDA